MVASRPAEGMARPVALPALPASPFDIVRVAGAILVVLLLGALVLWPVAAVVVQGLLTSGPPWPWRVAAHTLAVALVATLGALGPATLIAFTLMRFDIPGRKSAWQILRAGILMPPFIVALALLTLGLGLRVALVGVVHILPDGEWRRRRRGRHRDRRRQ